MKMTPQQRGVAAVGLRTLLKEYMEGRQRGLVERLLQAATVDSPDQQRVWVLLGELKALRDMTLALEREANDRPRSE